MSRASHKDWHSKEQLEKLVGWARDGLTDEQIAKNIGIRRPTLYAWKKAHPDIADALKKGKEVVDVEVENALLKRALGTTTKTTQYRMVKEDPDVLKAKRIKYLNEYKLEHPELTKQELTVAAALAIPTYKRIPMVETVQELPPDTKAIIFWLKNRLPEKYRDQSFRQLNEAQTRKAIADADRAEIENDRLRNAKDSDITKIVFTDDLKPDDDQNGDGNDGTDPKPK
ncbi:terminase [Limosilactobacillus reuteri]|uniref:terminase n=1 Tax=Limosilactobacillus reuteri TaxID=1598 RepID=UPI001E5B9EB0|nr:terminase [Limosilactobacillus reuteri]MCC4470028.1 terminase [Limosilactobacillus reuteri]